MQTVEFHIFIRWAEAITVRNSATRYPVVRIICRRPQIDDFVFGGSWNYRRGATRLMEVEGKPFTGLQAQGPKRNFWQFLRCGEMLLNGQRVNSLQLWSYEMVVASEVCFIFVTISCVMF
ncbi:hypothetical protein [Halodesulfovibrio marinisediminis]|uniref:hypothetical protein n=1 Tax=Halodesulfovibrio marinisediminis TaxID=458711 RepID=UPI000940E42F|nr:hypothetical protein [Halodesulfovibrio marinisediminis]